MQITGDRIDRDAQEAIQYEAALIKIKMINQLQKRRTFRLVKNTNIFTPYTIENEYTAVTGGNLSECLVFLDGMLYAADYLFTRRDGLHG